MNMKKKRIAGESFVFPDKSESSPISSSDEAINEKYKRGEIRIVTEQARYPLDSIENMLDSKKYDLNPEYQRRKRWDIPKKSRLIESFIMNVPVPPIFLYEVDYSIYEVMDGQQRLAAIYDFYKGSYELQELEYWTELNGKKYQNLPEQVKKGIDRRYLSSIVLLQETAKSEKEAEFLKQIVFERLNSGGEQLTAQETRNALQHGKFNQLCIELAKNDLFRKMWNLPLESEGELKLLKSEPYRKMEDVELVLRFFAYRHIEKFRGKVEKFLDEYLKQANKFPDETLRQLANLFNDTIDIIYQIFAISAFLFPQGIKERDHKKPAKIIYDSMMQAFARHIDDKEALKKNAEKIKENIYKNVDQGIHSKKYIFDGRANNRNDVIARIDYYHKFLQDYISSRES